MGLVTLVECQVTLDEVCGIVSPQVLLINEKMLRFINLCLFTSVLILFIYNCRAYSVLLEKLPAGKK